MTHSCNRKFTKCEISYLNVFIRAYNFIINRWKIKAKQILNVCKKLTFRLYIPRDIYEVFITGKENTQQETMVPSKKITFSHFVFIIFIHNSKFIPILESLKLFSWSTGDRPNVLFLISSHSKPEPFPLQGLLLLIQQTITSNFSLRTFHPKQEKAFRLYPISERFFTQKLAILC